MKKSTTVKRATPPRKVSAPRKTAAPDLTRTLTDLQARIAGLTERLERLEARAAPAAAPSPALEPAAAPPPAAEAVEPTVTEEEVLSISAALAAYLGVRLRIRQIRLLGSSAWAQQGRVSIQASHRLHS
jgi:methylmalonyl-CoA carboxyltransferase large subunit